MEEVPEPGLRQGQDPEGAFQRAVLAVIEVLLHRARSDGHIAEYFILQKFGLDIAVFLKRTNGSSLLRMFELKAFVGSRQGGVGFGNQRGEGPQVELLMLTDGQLVLCDAFVRWLLVNGIWQKGTERFVMFDNRRVRDAAMGGVRKGKQNNLRLSELMKDAVTWDTFCTKIGTFLMSSGSSE